MTILLYASKLLSVATGGAAPAWFSRRSIRRFTTSRSSASRPSRFFRASTRSYTGPLVVCAACQGTSQGLRVRPTPAPLANPARVHWIASHALGRRIQEGDAAVGVGGDDRIANAGERPARPAMAEALPGVEDCRLARLRGAGKTSHLDIRAAARSDRQDPRSARSTTAHPSWTARDLGQLVQAVPPLQARRSRQVGQARWRAVRSWTKKSGEWVEKKGGPSRLCGTGAR